ncbi:DUF4179 domain-containing protein [Candidatus Aerophobetes bacterium]|uniref:DUF4179 domain-containing protein n=1 Tax=Aerophobetes bacterium TaxID=2030807 RepID=A0A523S3Z1_UNCAE|nr:MAG: DUF4179 domain-containing protein [Candidatus Aerophobetes bacterium]
MKRYGMKGLMAILAVALVLGLATSALAAGKLSFGVKGGMGFMAPLKENPLSEKDYNDYVDDINQDLEDMKEQAEAAGWTITLNEAEKITRGWNVEGYMQYRITEMFGLRGSAGYLTGMKSDFGIDATISEGTEQLTVKNITTLSVSCLSISLEPTLVLPLGKFLLTLGGGPGYYIGKSSFNDSTELSSTTEGKVLDLTIDGSTSGSKIGYRGFLEGEYSTDSLIIGVELGYRSTGEIETTGEVRFTGEVGGESVDELLEEATGKLDFSGLYILLKIGFII